MSYSWTHEQRFEEFKIVSVPRLTDLVTWLKDHGYTLVSRGAGHSTWARQVDEVGFYTNSFRIVSKGPGWVIEVRYWEPAS